MPYPVRALLHGIGQTQSHACRALHASRGAEMIDASNQQMLKECRQTSGKELNCGRLFHLFIAVVDAQLIVCN